VKKLTLHELRRYALSRSLFEPTTLPKAIARLGFVQADPIRAPARAQDLTLRHRVVGYRAGDLEARYPKLSLEEDVFINYGFLPRATQALMHPRTPRVEWSKQRWAMAYEVLDFVREKGLVHPRDVEAQFQHGKAKNWFGGSSNASTQLLDGMHYRGLVRVARRDSGVRVYAEATRSEVVAADGEVEMDRLVDVIVAKYAPLPERSLGALIRMLRNGAPQWYGQSKAALARAKGRLPSAEVDGVRWYWPVGEDPCSKRYRLDETVRLLGPFDPIVWDRSRFELFWGWAYRFEAYTPGEACARVLCAATVVARANRWLGQRSGAGRRLAVAYRLCLGSITARSRLCKGSERRARTSGCVSWALDRGSSGHNAGPCR
jgi:uncharacterized protein